MNGYVNILNCRRCDDLVKLLDGKTRHCECGACQGTLDSAQMISVSGPGRVLQIKWEALDGIAEGEVRSFSILPQGKYRT